jgi:hypothetical protein
MSLLTSAPGALVKNTKTRNFVLRIVFFIHLKSQLYKFQDQFTIFSSLTSTGALISIFLNLYSIN